MKVAVWAAEVAKEFWARVGVEEPFPRNLRDPIRSLPLTLQPIPELTTARAFHWLQRVGIELEREDFEKEVSTGQPPFPFSPDRGLRGCLVARHGHGFLFVDAADPMDEQCFTLAHELAHFLRDYRRPRQLAVQHLGLQALEVLDGKRPATPGERVGALLGKAPLGFHVHLMDRDEQRRPVDWQSVDAEASADCLACELLAPAEHVYANRAGHETRTSLENRLVQHYGLPAAQARQYARQLLGAQQPVEPWLVALRESLQ